MALPQAALLHPLSALEIPVPARNGLTTPLMPTAVSLSPPVPLPTNASTSCVVLMVALANKFPSVVPSTLTVSLVSVVATTRARLSIALLVPVPSPLILACSLSVMPPLRSAPPTLLIAPASTSASLVPVWLRPVSVLSFSVSAPPTSVLPLRAMSVPLTSILPVPPLSLSCALVVATSVHLSVDSVLRTTAMMVSAALPTHALNLSV